MILIETEVICAIITVSGVVISSVIAFLVSKNSVEKEIEKMKMSWKREDSAASDEEFSEMITAVTRYVHGRKREDELPALEKLNNVRRKGTGDIYLLLDLFYRLTTIKDMDGNPDFRLLDKYLSQLIEQNRLVKRQEQAGH